jgi:hypothetical protein
MMHLFAATVADLVFRTRRVFRTWVLFTRWDAKYPGISLVERASGGGPTFIAENTDKGWKTAYGRFKSLHKEQSKSGLLWGISFPLDW